MHAFDFNEVPVLVCDLLLQLSHAHESLLSFVPIVLYLLKLFFLHGFELLMEFEVPLVPPIVVLAEQLAFLQDHGVCEVLRLLGCQLVTQVLDLPIHLVPLLVGHLALLLYVK